MKFMAHQKEGLDFLADKDGVGLHFEQGLGKTLTILEHLSVMSLQMRTPFPALITCPKSVVTVWEDEIKKFGYPFKIKKLVGTFRQRLRALEEPADIYVINYEGMRIMKAQLKKKGFKCMILDEAHRIKERSSKQTEVAFELGAITKYRFALTGTPVTKSPEDVWTQLHWISPFSLGNFYAFRSKYINFRKMMVKVKTRNSVGGSELKEISIPYSFKNLSENDVKEPGTSLEFRMGQHCLRKTKKECLDLPEKVYKTIHYEFSPEQKRHYYSLKNSLATILEDKTVSVKAAVQLMQKLQQVCQGFIYKEDDTTYEIADSGKLTMLKDALEDIAGEKSIIFAWFQHDIDRLQRELTASGYKVLLYDGNIEERSQIVHDFQTGSEPCIFLAQIEKAKEGITLTAASNVLYYGNSLNYASRVQSEDRAHRTGQSKTVVYYDFICKDAIDEYVVWLLQNKGEVADKITGDSIRLARMLLGREAA